jgi:predicted nucleic-acid-binding protein
MIAIDTNIVVRYAIKDDKRQAEAAIRFLKHNRCLLLPTVVLESVWVLASKKGYNLSRETVIERIKHIAGLPNVTVQDATALSFALQSYASGMDFADALHLGLIDSCSGFATMDQKMWLCAERLGMADRVFLLPMIDN